MQLHSTIPTQNQPLLATLICFDSHLRTSTTFLRVPLYSLFLVILIHTQLCQSTLSYTDQVSTILEQYWTILNGTYLHWTSIYKLFSPFLTLFRPHDLNPENSVSLKCRPMYVHLSAYVCLIYEKTNSLGLNWENKTLKTKRSICCLVYTIPIFLSFSLVHFHMGCTYF